MFLILVGYCLAVVMAASSWCVWLAWLWAVAFWAANRGFIRTIPSLGPDLPRAKAQPRRSGCRR